MNDGNFTIGIPFPEGPRIDCVAETLEEAMKQASVLSDNTGLCVYIYDSEKLAERILLGRHTRVAAIYAFQGMSDSVRLGFISDERLAELEAGE